MASSKARSRSRSASGKGGRSAAGSGSSGKNSSARTVAAVPATPTSTKKSSDVTAARSPKRTAVAQTPPPEETPELAQTPSGPPRWLQITSLVLAIGGLAVSAYETYAHFNGSHLAGCPSGAGGTFNCTAVITSSQSMVFGVIPVAVLGLAFYVFAVPIMTPWAWRTHRREVHVVRLASLIAGMGFVMYLIYAEIYQIGDVCEYCTGVHIITFLLFCITVVSAALWGLGERKDSAARP